MGEAAARKVGEIEETRRRLEDDLRELEDRLPAPLRSGKAVAGMLIGTLGSALVLRRTMSRRAKRTPPTEVVIRVVRDDEESSSSGPARRRR
jgi:hypothetical protein